MNIIKSFFAALSIFTSIQVVGQVDINIYVFNYNDYVGVPGVSVKLSNASLGVESMSITNAQGIARFSNLTIAGSYIASIEESNTHLGIQSDPITPRSNTDLSISLPLIQKIEQTIENIEVTATTLVNARNAEVSSILTEKEIKEIPAEGRDITRLLYRLPNVVQATGFYPEAPSVSINGANSLYNSYLIDGMDNNERFLGGMKFNAPVGMVSNINVLTNNFSSEYGNTANGVINVTSKSGTNDLSGEAFFVTRPGAVIDASSPYILRDLSGNQVKDGFQRYQAGFALGGAIIRDKTFYHVNAEYTKDNKDNYLVSPSLGVNTTVPGQNNFTYLSGKVDHKWSEHFKSAVRLNTGIVNIARQGGGLEGGLAFPSAANYQDRNSFLLASQNTYFKNNFKSESNLQYSRFRWNYGRAANVDAANVTVLDPQEQTIAVIGHPGYLFDSREATIQGQQKFTWYKDKHTIKTGIEVISSAHELFGGGNPNGSYTVKLSEAQVQALASKGIDLAPEDIPSDAEVLFYGVELRPQSFGTTQSIFSAYIEDEWSLSSKTTAAIGLRYDYDNLSKGGSSTGDIDNIAPRLSINHKLNDNGIIRGGYGIFYDKVLYAIYSDALQQNTTSTDYKKQLGQLVALGILPNDTDIDRITFDGNLGASANGVSYGNPPDISTLQEQRDMAFSNERRILNPNGYQNPYTHQMTLGYQKQVAKDQLFYIDGVYNRSYNLFRLRDLNAPTFYDIEANGGAVRTQAEADQTRPILISNNGSATINGEELTGVARTVVMTEAKGKSTYAGVSVNYQKDRGDDNFSYRLIYTLSRLMNDTEDINFRAEQANDFEREWAVSINDRTHVINAIVGYYPFKNMTISLAGLIQSGQPINRIPDATIYGTTDLNGDGRAFADAYTGNSDRQPGEGRNSDRLPWSNTFDLGAAYEWGIGGSDDKIVLRADVFNVLNAVNYSGYFNNATQSNQVQVGPASSGVLVRRNAAPPRQFQFSLRYVF